MDTKPELKQYWKYWGPKQKKFWTKKGKKTNRRANFYVVHKSHKTGVFYKWSDCVKSIAGLKDAKFTGYQKLQDAYDAYSKSSPIE